MYTIFRSCGQLLAKCFMTSFLLPSKTALLRPSDTVFNLRFNRQFIHDYKGRRDFLVAQFFNDVF
jgi:hypothetical protein